MSLSEFRESSGATALQAAPSKNTGSRSLCERIFGLRTVSDLGILTTSLTAAVDIPVVNRSSSLRPDFYGSRFWFWEYAKARNAFTGVITHLAFTIGFLAVLLSPVRMLLQKFVFSPGQGPEQNEALKHGYVEYRGIATADEDPKNGGEAKRAFGKFVFEGDMYWFTGLLLAEAAMVILKNEEELVKKSGGGLLTPSTLGQEYVDRLEKAGVVFETKMLQY